MDLVFPTMAEIRRIEQEKLPRLTQDRLGFDLMPMETKDDFAIVWEQMDNYQGLQQVRGLDGAFPKVNKVGLKRYMTEPGVYGEFADLNETELTRRRRIGTWANRVDVTDMVMENQDLLLQRRLDRLEYIIWTLLSTGTFSVANIHGGVTHTDTFPLQTFTAGIPWATSLTAIPLANFRSVQTQGPARGANFNGTSRAIMNRFTFNLFITNTNQNDLGGRRLQGLMPVNTREEANRILMGEDLPQIEVYDEGYFTEAGSFTRYIPNSKVIVIGSRPSGSKIGTYRMVRNINNPGYAPGPYTEVITRRDPPKKTDIFDGHNGGPVVWFPGSIVMMAV